MLDILPGVERPQSLVDVVLPRGGEQLPNVSFSSGDRLFQEDVIARREQRHRSGHVLVIHGGVDDGAGGLAASS